MSNLDDIIEEEYKLNETGQLTIDKIFHPGFYRILEGKYANRIVIYSLSRIDGENILTFANGMTWVYKNDLNGVGCERSYPEFNSPIHEVNLSESSWYGDDGSGPIYYRW